MSDVALVCGALGSAGALTYGFHRKVVVPVVDSMRGLKASAHALAGLVPIAQELVGIVPVVKELVAELKPNGGSSLRDSVNRIEDGMMHNRMLARNNFALVGEPYFETDRAGRCTWVNQAYMRLVGLPLHECMGFGWYNAVHQDDRTMVAGEWARALEQRKTFVAKFRLDTYEGVVPVNCRITFSFDRNERVIGSIGVVTTNPHSTFAEEELGRGAE